MSAKIKVTGQGGNAFPSCSVRTDKMKQSLSGILQSAISVKKWMEKSPSVDLVRPAKCPRCDHAAREPGRPLGLHGHGTRFRQLRGPPAVGRPSEEIEIELRRYRCQSCGAAMTVGPAGLLTQRLFTAMAIGLALALWSGGRSHAAVRGEVSAWSIVGAAAHARWNSLRRWARAAGRGRLWPHIKVSTEWTPREIAKRVTAILMSRGPPDECAKARVFAGAAHIA